MKKIKIQQNKIILTIFIFMNLFLFNLHKINAEITHPYIIDEKDQVLFGDSSIIVDGENTYHGLENYKQDYVNGYAHFTFTRTHDSCCYASYPPLVYITDIDPRSSVLVTQKEINSINGGVLTDWYAYDIQFNSTGYVVSIKEKDKIEVFHEEIPVQDLLNTDWVSIANHYPLSNPPLEYSMAFIPVPIKEPSLESAHSNVLFIPGIEASRLYLSTNNSENQLWEPNRNADIEKLYLDENGSSVIPGIYTEDIINETPIGQNIYKSFSNTMDGLVQDGIINEWKSFPYDWRQSVEDIIDNGTLYGDGNKSIIDTLQSLIDSSANHKVTIIAHSNGGLVAKYLLSKLQKDKDNGINNLVDHIDVLILVAVPQIGTAVAVPAILHGYDQEIAKGVIMNKEHARELGRNMLSAYGLLPSSEYIEHVSASTVLFDDQSLSNVVSVFTQYYGNSISTYSKYKDFLFGYEGRSTPNTDDILNPIKLSSDLYSQAENLHNEIDNWIPPINMRVIEVAGWGLDTVAGYKYYAKQVGCTPSSGVGCNPFILDEEPVFTQDGDKTVVAPSANYMDSDNVEQYWVNIERYNNQILGGLRHNREHKDIFEVNSLNKLITSVLEGNNIEFDNVLVSNQPLQTKNRLRMSVHSPVAIDAYDIDGNHTGKVCTEDSDFCYLEEEIVNSSYLEFGEGKYINLPEEEFSKVVLEGADIGTFTFESNEVLPDGIVNTSVFKDIPVTSETVAEISKNQSTNDLELKIDVDGNGHFDITLEPSEDFDPVAYLQVIRETVESLDLNRIRKFLFIKRIDRVINLIKKGKINKAELGVDRFTSVLEKRIDRKDPKKLRPHRLTKDDAEELLTMLENLLDKL